MKFRSLVPSMMLFAAMLVSSGCKLTPARLEAAVQRPDQVSDFAILYQANCVACHGANGKNGVAISLANPVYLAFAGTDIIQNATASGVHGSLMPAFAKTQGGMLTEAQISILAHGVESAWAKPATLGGQSPPPYASSSAGDPVWGAQAFHLFCGSCHGADGAGLRRQQKSAGSLVDPAYLGLISDQGLRSLIVAGQPEDGMPDWQSDILGTGARAMTEQEITDTVAWLASHRVASPGQPYMHP